MESRELKQFVAKNEGGKRRRFKVSFLVRIFAQKAFQAGPEGKGAQVDQGTQCRPTRHPSGA